MNPVKTFKNGNTQSLIEQARAVASNLGVPASAGMLRNRGFSLEATLWILFAKEAV